MFACDFVNGLCMCAVLNFKLSVRLPFVLSLLFLIFFLVSSATATVSSMLEIEAGLASRESSVSASASAARFPCVPVCVLLQEKADDWINVSKSRRFLSSIFFRLLLV